MFMPCGIKMIKKTMVIFMKELRLKMAREAVSLRYMWESNRIHFLRLWVLSSVMDMCIILRKKTMRCILRAEVLKI